MEGPCCCELDGSYLLCCQFGLWRASYRTVNGTTVCVRAHAPYPHCQYMGSRIGQKLFAQSVMTSLPTSAHITCTGIHLNIQLTHHTPQAYQERKTITQSVLSSSQYTASHPLHPPGCQCIVPPSHAPSVAMTTQPSICMPSSAPWQLKG